MKRCPNGSRRNKKNGLCEKTGLKKTLPGSSLSMKATMKKCPNGSRRNKKTGVCVKTHLIPPPPSPSLQSPKFKFVEETTELMNIFKPFAKNKMIRFQKEVFNHDIHKVDGDGLTELMRVIIDGNNKCVKELLDLVLSESPPLEYWNYRLNTNETILHIAITSSSIYTLEKICKIPGLDYSAQTTNELTPLLMLCKFIFETMGDRKYLESFKLYKRMLRILLADASEKDFNLGAKDIRDHTARYYFVRFAEKEGFKLSDFPEKIEAENDAV